jgi:hypothetical protein
MEMNRVEKRGKTNKFERIGTRAEERKRWR